MKVIKEVLEPSSLISRKFRVVLVDRLINGFLFTFFFPAFCFNSQIILHAFVS